MQKRVEAASVERQILDELAIDDGAYRRRFRIDERCPALDRNDFRDRAEREREVNCHRVLNVDDNVRLDDRLETDLGHLHPVVAGWEIWDDVDSLGVGHARVLHSCRVVHYEHFSASDRRSRRVGHNSTDRSGG